MSNDSKSIPSYVAYFRVSPQRQGQSGLGIEGQQREITLANRHLVPIASFGTGLAGQCVIATLQVLLIPLIEGGTIDIELFRSCLYT